MYDDIDAYSRTMGLPPATVSRIESWIDRLHEDGWNLVARDGDRVVGHVAVYENVGFEVVERMRTDLEMALSLEKPVAERVQRPPAERE